MSWIVLVSVLVVVTVQVVVADDIHSPEPKRVVTWCFYGGRRYRVGQQWNPDPCTFCRCDVGGKLACAVRDCARPNCENYYTPPGQCCPICPTGTASDVTV
ncbi:von Willebrand factor C domain-containing protein 2-like [Physella acuta]|uniref:von Willebrand factor C domain-containing protein 2-like n=1 Tax=Physella acuta TaxID=109671 RepID=UPI0027DDDD0B|nr:von Willebrand factor C domain-containing protein 2-like [Physella acuta]